MKPTVPAPATYWFLFSLLFLVYLPGLFVPLMDNDSAHHANIALRMYLTGDYVSLVDNGKDYLDKPHLHFWLCALSYHLFGVSAFAYKFPSFLFTILGTYSTYRLGRSLYDKETGKLSALIVASAFAYILANNDVRMDAILTGSIVFATWQLVDWSRSRRLINALGAALGLALGFCTKGHIAVFTPAIGLLFYILYRKEWQLLYHPHILVIIALFFLFISPVVYSYYLQYDLHPEKIIRGRKHVSGVEFILWKQNIERFEGDSFGSDAKNDYLFFFHSFLWAFAPWSIIAFWAFFSRIRNFFSRRYEWLTIGTFAVLLVLISLSSFKLPHYLNIIFPITAVFTSAWLLNETAGKFRNPRIVWIIQLVLCIILILAAFAVKLWAFPVISTWQIICAIVLLLLVIYFVLNKGLPLLQKAIVVPVATITFLFFLLNTNFYPALLHYQGGKSLAAIVNRQIGAQHVYFWENIYSSSLCYYTASLRKPFSDSLLNKGQPVWLVADAATAPLVAQQYITGKRFRHVDYEITQLQLNFINPATRREATSSIWLIEILGKK